VNSDLLPANVLAFQGRFESRLDPSSRAPVAIDTWMHEAPQQAALAIEDRACVTRLDRPTPRVGDIERGADLRGAAVRHHEEPPPIFAGPAITLAEVEHDAGRGALDLIGEVTTVAA